MSIATDYQVQQKDKMPVLQGLLIQLGKTKCYMEGIYKGAVLPRYCNVHVFAPSLSHPLTGPSVLHGQVLPTYHVWKEGKSCTSIFWE